MAAEMMKFTAKDKELLVKIVKLAQAYKIEGSKGDWKEFLDSEDRKFGSSISDPTKKSWCVLAAFVETFTDMEDRELVIRFIKWFKRFEKQQLQITKVLDKASPKQELVRLTFEHPLFLKGYVFPSFEKGWMIIKSRKLHDASDVEKMIAIDCEMVQCEDRRKEVVKVCVVNEKLETLIDTLVKPSKPVVDYLTAITGITAEDLEDVTCDLQDIQKRLKRLLKHGTILVGHSLNNDLQALRVDHSRVIDTRCIFRYHNKPSYYSPGLSKLCKIVLGYDLREEGKSHNCLDDAIAAMRLTLAKLDLGLNDPIDLGDTDVGEPDLLKLYIHKIPSSVSVEDLMNLFPKKYSVEIQAFTPMRNKFNTTYAVFKSSKDANEAFENLRGVVKMDSFQRPQKCVWFNKRRSKTGANMGIRVRKMNVVADKEAQNSQFSDYRKNPGLRRKRSNESTNNISECNTYEETLDDGKKTKPRKV